MKKMLKIPLKNFVFQLEKIFWKIKSSFFFLGVNDTAEFVLRMRIPPRNLNYILKYCILTKVIDGLESWNIRGITLEILSLKLFLFFL